MNTRPWFSVAVDPPGPMLAPTDATAGSFGTTSSYACMRWAMAGNEMSCAAFGEADDQSGILLGKEPLGNDDIQIAGESDGSEHDHQGHEPVPQRDLEAALIGADQAVEAASDSR